MWRDQSSSVGRVSSETLHEVRTNAYNDIAFEILHVRLNALARTIHFRFFPYSVKQDVTVETVKAEVERLSESDLKEVMCYLDDSNRSVSSDIIGCQYSAVVDFRQIQVIDKLVSIGAWYDNEIGYTHTVLDLLKHMMDVDGK